MGQYIKKPRPITAEQVHTAFYVDTLEGKMYGKPGDYLVTGIHGEQYPCDKAFFEEFYDQVCPHGHNGGRCVEPWGELCYTCKTKVVK